MDNGLLIRIYNVRLGDCIYLQVPDTGGSKHILIDCGTLAGKREKLLEKALADIREQLPDVGDGTEKKRLDLLVVTHPHQDHMRGFFQDMWEKLFNDITVKQIWLSTYMDPEHTQAIQAFSLQETASAALNDLRNQSFGPAIDILLADLSANENKKFEAIEILRKHLPNAKHIEPQYVDAEKSREGKLSLFDDTAIGFQVLAPKHNIDHYYLGMSEDGSDEHVLQGFGEFKTLISGSPTVQLKAPPIADSPPQNISKSDFRLLRSRLHHRAFAFLQWKSSLENDISVVLLLEWHGWRLLFTGDAERKISRGGQYTEGSGNGSWNVMWHERNETKAFDKPLDFLKVGHHGSENASPWSNRLGATGSGANQMDKMLEMLLPQPSDGRPPTAIAVVSASRHGSYKKAIPDRALMEVLGERVVNPVAGLSDVEKYPPLQDSMRNGEPALVPPDILQPLRTDLAIDDNGQPAKYIEVVFPSEYGAQVEVNVG